MKVKGVMAAKVKILPKGGAMFKVALPELGDTFPVYQEVASPGIELVHMLEDVNVEFDGMYANKAGQIQLQGVVVTPMAAANLKAVKAA